MESALDMAAAVAETALGAKKRVTKWEGGESFSYGLRRLCKSESWRHGQAQAKDSCTEAHNQPQAGITPHQRQPLRGITMAPCQL